MSFGLVDGRPVFMDIAEDLYFQLAPYEERSFFASLEKSQRICGVIVQGLAWRSEGMEWTIELVGCPPPPQRIVPSEAGYSNFAEIVAVGKIVLSVRSALRLRSIAEILEPLATRRSVSPVPAIDPLMSATRFHNARRLVPLRGNCLSNSLALIGWLAQLGAAATLVFGVKLDPFAAHCWVQSGPFLLSDYPERVERFTPVRILECTPAMR